MKGPPWCMVVEESLVEGDEVGVGQWRLFVYGNA